MNKFVKDYWRITTEGDPVPQAPPALVFAKCLRFSPALYIGSWRYRHAGRNAHLKYGGQIVFDPTPFEKGMIMDIKSHKAWFYEQLLEDHLRARRKWRWRKIRIVLVFVVRLAKPRKLKERKTTSLLDVDVAITGSCVVVGARGEDDMVVLNTGHNDGHSNINVIEH